VKTCQYCGRQNADDRVQCEECWAKLPAQVDTPATGTASAALTPDGFLQEKEPLDLSGFDLGISFEAGFSRPDWPGISKRIRSSFPQEQWKQLWREIPRKWLAQLREDLGGIYHCYESHEFLLVSATTPENSRAMLRNAETALVSIRARLQHLAWRWEYGKPAILSFEDADDYYTYISYYYPEGHFSNSSGMFIGRDYGQIALPFRDIRFTDQILVHELTHDCLSRLRLPLWLNEGFAQGMERELFRQGMVLDDQLATEHYAFWNETNIQEFWAGSSFRQPGQASHLSYNLAAILIQVLSENWNNFLAFAKDADYQDAGQDAALKILDRSLGDAVGDFLGPGDWRPQRKAIAEILSQGKSKKSGDEEKSTAAGS
jgi:hypothetical protein